MAAAGIQTVDQYLFRESAEVQTEYTLEQMQQIIQRYEEFLLEAERRAKAEEEQAAAGARPRG